MCNVIVLCVSNNIYYVYIAYILCVYYEYTSVTRPSAGISLPQLKRVGVITR